MSIIRSRNEDAARLLRAHFEVKNLVGPGNKLAYAVIRVSDKRQKGEGHYSDQEQRQVIETYATEEGYQIVKIFEIAESASKHGKRREFNRIIEGLKLTFTSDQRVDHLIFSHQSRSNRNRESARGLEELVDLGVTLHFARDRRKFTTRSDLSEHLLWFLGNVNSEEYTAELRKNVVGGMVRRCEEGLYPGKAPYGYRNYRPHEDARSVFKIKEDEAAYLIRAFELCATGNCSLKSLSKELSVLFPGLRNRPHFKLLYTLLRKAFYYGDFDWKGVRFAGNPEYHPPLITKDLWDHVQEILNRRGGKRTSKKSFHFAHMLKCGGTILDDQGYATGEACGCVVTAEEKRKPQKAGPEKTYNYYHCSRTDRVCSQRDKFHMRSIVGRKTVNYSESEIEGLFQATFKPFDWKPEIVTWMQQVLRQEHEQRSGDHRQQVAALRRRYDMLQAHMDEIYDDKLAKNLTAQEWQIKHERFKRERDGIHQQILALDTMKDDYIENGVLLIELAQRSESVYKNATPREKRKLVEYVSSNWVLKDGSIEITYRKPFDLLVESGGSDKWWPHQESNLELTLRKGPFYPFKGISNGNH